MHAHGNSQWAAVVLGLCDLAFACSRVTYKAGVDDRITIGRSMDFVADTNTTIWALPAGHARTGAYDENEQNPLTWEAKYGSISTLMYNKIYTEGMNSEGLTASLLYLDGSEYGERDLARPGLSISMWNQYFLDMFATVEEATVVCPVGEDGPEMFQIVATDIVPGVNSVGHVAISDKFGDNLIMEYIEGRLICYHSPNYTVMTNEPSYDQQLAIDTYWTPVSAYALPGTSKPADRFARLSYYNRVIIPAADLETAVSLTAGMVRAVSTPLVPDSMILDAGKNDVWPTLWRTYEDTKDMVFFYESATNPMLFWVDYANFDLSREGEAKVLSLVGEPWRERIGDVSAQFVGGGQPFGTPS